MAFTFFCCCNNHLTFSGSKLQHLLAHRSEDEEPYGLRGWGQEWAERFFFLDVPQEDPHPCLSNFQVALTFLGSGTLSNVQSQGRHWLSIAVLSYSHLPLLRLPSTCFVWRVLVITLNPPGEPRITFTFWGPQSASLHSFWSHKMTYGSRNSEVDNFGGRVGY